MKVDTAVIGRGLWGSAAAMYLARAGQSVALIGPLEPTDPRASRGPFASHHDAGRITRSLARDAVWARAASRSIARYSKLSIESGEDFYAPCGGMMASDEPDYMRDVLDVARSEGLAHDVLEGPSLAKRFEMFSFAPGTLAAWDPTGGAIDPRAMRRAHETLATRAGTTVFDEPAVATGSGAVVLRSGKTVQCGHILVTTGAYAGLSDLVPARPDLIVCGRTVFFAEVDEAEAQRLSGMPSLIWRPSNRSDYLYLLPPIRYPDGRLLIKIGGEPDDFLISTEEEASAWFHGTGNHDVADALRAALRELMPDLKITAGHQAPCILAHSPTGLPYIGRLSDSMTLATACCGAGAKSADEWGRIAAEIAMGNTGVTAELGADTAPSFS